MPATHIRYRTWDRRLALAVWTAGLTGLSLLPLPMKRLIGTTGTWHDAGHVACFAITAVLLLLAKPTSARSLPGLWPVLMLAFALEWLEAELYASRFEWKDIVMDILGMLLAIVFVRLRER